MRIATKTTELGFELPDSFDVDSYNGVFRVSRLIADPNDPTRPTKRNAWHSYSAAWTGLAVRLRASLEYSAEFGESIARSTAPPHDERYRQERALYGSLSSALSAVECAYMAVYCLSSALAPDKLPLSTAKHLNQTPLDVAQALRSWVPNDAFSEKLLALALSPEMQSLADFRNTLAHRGVLPRHHRLSNAVALPSTLPSNPKALAGDFNFNEDMSASTTAAHAGWASETCSTIATDFHVFLRRWSPSDA